MLRTLWISLAFWIWPAAESDAGEPIDRLAQSVQFKTISYQEKEKIDYAEFEDLNSFLIRSFPLVFSSMEFERVNDYSLLLTWRGADASLRPVLFTAHTDVVPVEPGTEDDWEHPPFKGSISNGKLYGRGTLDDKVGVLSLLEAAERLLAAGMVPSRTLVFAFGHDEEIGGKDGAAAIAELFRARSMSFLWMLDEGGVILSDNPLLPSRPVAMINIAEKAYVTLTLVASGEGGHSSRPPKVSTIGRLARAMDRIERNPFEPRLSKPVEAMLETIAPHVGQPERFVFSNLWLTGGLVARQMAQDRLTNSFVRSTTALTMFNAGVKENVVPQRAEARVNFRLLPGDNPEDLATRIAEIIDDPAIEIHTAAWNSVPPVANPSGPGFAVVATAARRNYDDLLAIPSLLTATTDTRHYVDVVDDQYRFHGVLMKSGQTSSIHGTNEYIEVDSYDRSIDIAADILRLAAQPDASVTIQ